MIINRKKYLKYAKRGFFFVNEAPRSTNLLIDGKRVIYKTTRSTQ